MKHYNIQNYIRYKKDLEDAIKRIKRKDFHEYTRRELVSDTGNRGGANNVTNGTSFLVKDVSIPVGSSLELLSGGKVVMETTDVLRIDCSVTDKVSGTLSIMEIT